MGVDGSQSGEVLDALDAGVDALRFMARVAGGAVGLAIEAARRGVDLLSAIGGVYGGIVCLRQVWEKLITRARVRAISPLEASWTLAWVFAFEPVLERLFPDWIARRRWRTAAIGLHEAPARRRAILRKIMARPIDASITLVPSELAVRNVAAHGAEPCLLGLGVGTIDAVRPALGHRLAA